MLYYLESYRSYRMKIMKKTQQLKRITEMGFENILYIPMISCNKSLMVNSKTCRRLHGWTGFNSSSGEGNDKAEVGWLIIYFVC